MPTTSSRINWMVLTLGGILYAALTMMGPISSNRFGLGGLQIRLLQLTIVLPIILIWLAAVYGATKFKNYSLSIKSSADGRGLDKISTGLEMLVLGLIVGSIISATRPYAIAAGYREAIVVFANYLQIIFPLAAFWLMHAGSRELVGLTKNKKDVMISWALAVIPFLSFVWLYIYAVFSNPYRNTSPDPALFSSYYLNDTAIALTIILPYVAIWLLGSLTAINIRSYMKFAQGLIYRQALSKLGSGLFAVVVFSILLQFMAALNPLLAGLGINGVLVLVYLIIVLYAVGYLLIASGAKKLAKIEEV